MYSPNKPRPTAAEKQHILRVKMLPCSLCNRVGPSEAHEIEQGLWFTSVALCACCHRDPVMGWHGQRRQWAISKMTMLQALNVTVCRLMMHPAAIQSIQEAYL